MLRGTQYTTLNLLPIDKPLGDNCTGFQNFCEKVLKVPARVCNTHVSSIPANNGTFMRRFTSQEVYTWFYELVVRSKYCSFEDSGVKLQDSDRLCDWLADLGVSEPAVADRLVSGGAGLAGLPGLTDSRAAISNQCSFGSRPGSLPDRHPRRDPRRQKHSVRRLGCTGAACPSAHQDPLRRTCRGAPGPRGPIRKDRRTRGGLTDAGRIGTCRPAASRPPPANRGRAAWPANTGQRAATPLRRLPTRLPCSPLSPGRHHSSVSLIRGRHVATRRASSARPRPPPRPAASPPPPRPGKQTTTRPPPRPGKQTTTPPPASPR